MIKSGFDLHGFIPAKNRTEVMDYYKTIFGMEEVYHHMDMKLKIDGKLFFEVREVSEGQYQAYMKAISSNSPILASAVEYETKADVIKIHQLLSTEALHIDEPATLPWSPCSFYVIDKCGVSWYISTPMHLPCSDCTKPTCEGDWDSKCRLPKWTAELYEKHGADWWRTI